MKSTTRTLLADVGLASVALFWGIGFVVMKDALVFFPPFFLLAVRFFLAGGLLALIFAKSLRGTTLKDLKIAAGVGLLLFLGFATQTVGLQYTTAGKQAFLTASYVVLVPFAAWALRRRIPEWNAFAASFLCLVGTALLTLQESFSISLGDGLTLACAGFYSLHIVSLEAFAPRMDAYRLATLQLLFVSCYAALCVPFFETIPDLTQLGGGAWWSMAYLVLFCTTGAFLIQTVAQKFTPSTHASIFLSLESVFGAAAGILLMGDVFTSPMVMGCVLILAAVFLTEMRPELLLARFRKAFSEGRP